MKIKNKFLIPVIAILIAMLMVGGGVSGTAADTSASEDTSTTHPLTYIPPSIPTTAGIEEEIDGIVSNVIGGLVSNPDQVGSDIREQSGFMDKLLTAMTNFIDAIINFAKKIGDFLGNW